MRNLVFFSVILLLTACATTGKSGLENYKPKTVGWVKFTTVEDFKSTRVRVNDVIFIKLKNETDLAFRVRYIDPDNVSGFEKKVLYSDIAYYKLMTPDREKIKKQLERSEQAAKIANIVIVALHFLALVAAI